MKTSNKIVAIAFLVIIVSAIGYAIAMKKEFLTGNYKKPYINFSSLPYKNFNSLIINPSSMINVKLVQGPFKVMINNIVKDNLIFKQVNNTLQIDLNWGYVRFNTGDTYMMVISCPKLISVHVNAVYTLNKLNIVDTLAGEGWAYHQVLIEGFKQDSLSVIQEWGSQVVLANNNFVYLNALTSINELSGSKLTVLKSNIIQQANFDVRNKGKLILYQANIPGLNYSLADSALFVMNGAAIKSLKK
ncbi:MAG: hypothetical protein JWR38_4736 [Mucilaginibacter sp.]|nr:hypothetical protein [Mucilaginibacter sp.]